MNRPQKRLNTMLILSAARIVFVAFLMTNTATGDNTNETVSEVYSALYASTIAETYDFKFGPNPFAPSNASSATGTFILGEKFLPATRCATCHTDAHAQWRQSARGLPVTKG